MSRDPEAWKRLRLMPPERPVCVKPSELREMLAFCGLRDHRADTLVRLLRFMGTLKPESRALQPEVQP